MKSKTERKWKTNEVTGSSLLKPQVLRELKNGRLLLTDKL